MAPRAFPQTPYTPPDGSFHILLVRHGESQPFIEDEPFPVLGDGQGDPPLAPEGHESAELVGERLAAEGDAITAIYATTLVRTQQTAEPLAKRLNLEPIIVADLREIHLGEWDGGLSRQKFLDGDPLAIRAAAEGRWDVIPGAEPADAFAARIRRGIETITAAHTGGLAVAFVHGGVIREVVQQATGAHPFRLPTDNTGITHLIVEPERWTIRTMNDNSHRFPRFADKL